MTIIRNSEELAKLIDENKNLIIDDDVKIEFNVSRGEIRNLICWDLNCDDLNCGNLDYFATCISYKDIKCKSWKNRRKNALDPICLDGKLKLK